MKNFNISLIAAAIALAFSAGAQAASLSKAEFSAGKSTIATEYKSAKAGCDSFAANAKDICLAEAKGREHVAKAELDAAYKPGVKARYNVGIAKAEADYSVAREKCDDKAGNDKGVCVKEAKAVEVKALADAKLNKQVGEARSDANADVRDADYKVATEKCDSLAGDAKASCMASAKSRFGKT